MFFIRTTDEIVDSVSEKASRPFLEGSCKGGAGGGGNN